MKKISKIVSAFVCLAMAVGVGVAIESASKGATKVSAEEEVYYSLVPASGSNNSYAGNCDIDIEAKATDGGYSSTDNLSITWNLTGNSQMQPWRIGGKNLSGVDRELYSKTAMPSAITKVEMEIGTASSVTINSASFIVSSNSNFAAANIIDTVSLGSDIVSQTVTIEPTSGDSWAANSYYKFVFNVTIGGSNKFVQFTGAKFYYEASNPITAISVSPDEVNLIPGGTASIAPTTTPTSGYTDTISWWSDDTSVATVSNGTITAVADGVCNVHCYVDANNNGQWDSGEVHGMVDVYVETPTSPFVTPAKSSTSGYTGGNETLSFTYGNLAGTLGVTSSNTNVVTVGTPSASAGEGTVQINFVGDGSTTVKFKDGSNELASVSVAVTQALRPVMATDTSAWDYTFTEKAWSAAGDWTLDDKLWNMSGVDDGSPYYGYDGTKGQQFGSGSHPFSSVSLQSSAFSGTVDSVIVYTSGASSINATVQVSVGGTAYGNAATITNTNTAYTFDLGGKSGTISIDYVNSSSKAIYIKEIVVNTISGSHDIANVAGHEAAQKAVVKFAKAFNAAMDTTEGCTTNMSSAWSNATSAWNTFLSEAAALGSAEEAYAKNLIKYATAQWTDDTDEDYSYCLERAMATYECCVNDHGQTAFMSAVRPAGAKTVAPVLFGNDNAVAIIIIVSVLSITAIGGFYFLRKRKEQ